LRVRAAKDLVRGLLVVDPSRRLSASEVLRHSWVAAGNASARPLSAALVGGLSKIQAARMRFRGAVQSVLATIKLGKLRALSGAGAGEMGAAAAGGAMEIDAGEAGVSAGAAATGAGR